MNPRFSKICVFAAAIACLLVNLAPRCGADGSNLAAGDVIAVVVDGEKDYSKTYQINDTGCITMSQIAPVKLEGLNTSDAASAIAKSLKKVLINPQVTAAFVERAKMQLFVVGQVKKPGNMEAGVGDRVMQILAQAGYDDSADLSRVSIQRGKEIVALDLRKYLQAEDLNVNVEVRSGDTIVVPRLDSVGTVMIMGQVSKPGAVPLSRNMTFREAIGLIGGVLVDADTDKITIKRESNPQPQLIDYKRAMDGDPAANIALQPQDAIYVPEYETSFFTVMGGVNRPGQYPIKGKMTLSEAIGLGGGPIPNVGDLRKVQLVRGQKPGGQPGDTSLYNLKSSMVSGAAEPLIGRGDVIYVAEHKPKPSLMEIMQSLMPLGWLLR